MPKKNAVFLKFMGAGLLATVPWVYLLMTSLNTQWLELASRRLESKISMIPVSKSPRTDGLEFRAVGQIFRAIEQHYVEAQRLDLVALLQLGIADLQKVLGQPLLSGVVSSPGLNENLEDSLSCLEPGNLVFEPCASQNIELGQRALEAVLEQSRRAEKRRLLVFHLPRLMQTLVIPTDGDFDEPAGFVSAALLQWITDLGLERDGLVLRSYLNAVLAGLDPHSAFLNEAEYEDLRGGTRGQFGGVGVVINEFHGLPFVREIVPNSPAQMAGIEPNDVLIRVDPLGETLSRGNPIVTLSGLDEVLRLIRSQTKEGPLAAWFFRPHSSRVYKTFFSREEVPTQSVEERTIPEAPDVLHLRVFGFSSRTSDEIYDAYLSAVRRTNGKLTALILDLRGNPGGLLDQAVQVSNLFLTKGKIVVTKSRYDTQAEQATPGQLINLPMVLLMNSSSASASEIVAGALRDSGRALIVGERSFGKGSVQSLFEIPRFGALKLTIAHYFTPAGHSIQNTGVSPHVDLRLVQKKQLSLLVAGKSEPQQEVDLSLHLENPTTAEESKGPYQSKNWIWSNTTDDLSRLGDWGFLSFSYPNFENTDHITRIKEDAYVRVALDFIRDAEASQDGVWSLVKGFESALPQIRLHELQGVFPDLEFGQKAMAARLVFLKPPAQGERDPFELQVSVSPQDRTTKNRPSARVCWVGFEPLSDGDQPSIWQPVQLTPSDSAGGTLRASFEPSRLFWTAWSALQLQNSRGVQIYFKDNPMSAPQHLLSWTPGVADAKVTEDSLGVNILGPLTGSPNQQTVHLDFSKVLQPGVEGPCEVLLAPLVNTSIRAETSQVDCKGAQLRVTLNSDGSNDTSFGGIIAVLVRDRYGAVLLRRTVLEVDEGRLKVLEN